MPAGIEGDGRGFNFNEKILHLGQGDGRHSWMLKGILGKRVLYQYLIKVKIILWFNFFTK